MGAGKSHKGEPVGVVGVQMCKCVCKRACSKGAKRVMGQKQRGKNTTKRCKGEGRKGQGSCVVVGTKVKGNKPYKPTSPITINKRGSVGKQQYNTR